MDYATMQSILGWAAIAAALVAGGIVGAMLVYDLGKPLWRRLARLWRRSPVECVAAVSLLCYCVAWGGGKITFPRTNAEYELLKDAGSYATNDTLHVAYTAHALLPDTADLQVYRRAADSTNDADWAAAWASTVGASPSPFDLDIEGATNWNYAVFTTWQPAPAVQTNGVLHVDWVVATTAETAAASAHALAAVPVKSTVVAGQVNFASGVVETVTETLAPQHARTAKTQTEEEYYYEKYAPDTAILVDLDAADTNTVWVVSACFNRGSEAYTVDWGDGTVTAHTSSYWGTKAEHTYAERGQYVVRLSDSLSQPLYHYGIKISPALSRLLRWGDHVTHADYAFGWARTAPIGLPGGEMARWPTNLTSANSTYQSCSGLTGSIPAWPSNLTSANWTYCGCTSLTGAWTDDPDELMPAHITSHSCTVLWASDALRALFYEDWSGTRKEGE